MAEGSPWGRPEGDEEKPTSAETLVPEPPADPTDESHPPVDGPVSEAAGGPASEPIVAAPADASAAAPVALADTIADEAPEEAPTEVVAAPRARDNSGSAAIALLGMLLLVLSALVVGLVVYITTRDDGDSYPADLENDQYDLAAMALRQRDVPQGMQLAGKVEFNNEEWAGVIDEVDPESRLPQLDAQQRVRNHISIFGWPDGGTYHLAQTLSLLSQSTLYETEEAASEAIAGSALCGLRLNEAVPVDEFAVPTIGEESVGFFLTETDEQIGKSVETVICFRTGRVVHGVVQSALDGAQDIGLVVSLAERMLVHVDHTFEGNPDPIDEAPEQGG